MDYIYKYWWFFLLGFIIRIFIIEYTSFFDATLPVKYTDVDYMVFSDAAKLIFNGFSPYDRSTYRYSPLLAIMMIPNVYWPQFGKYAFSIADIFCAILIAKILYYWLGNPKNSSQTKTMDDNLMSSDKIRRVATQNRIPDPDSKSTNKRYHSTHPPRSSNESETSLPALSPRAAVFWSGLYLFSPLAINMSTRGSADSLICALVFLSLYLTLTNRYISASVVYGLTVHMRIYPIVFSLALFLYVGWRNTSSSLNPHLSHQSSSNNSSSHSQSLPLNHPSTRPDKNQHRESENTLSLRTRPNSSNHTITRRQYDSSHDLYPGDESDSEYEDLPLLPRKSRPPPLSLADRLTQSLSLFTKPSSLLFAVASASVFFLLLGLFYYIYGYSFIYETYTYHLSRKDHRHNFSPYFYLLYLSSSPSLETVSSSFQTFLSRISTLAFIPQAILITFISFTTYKNVPLSLTLLTIVFVMLNKVMTAQYFLWWTSLVPLIAPSLTNPISLSDNWSLVDLNHPGIKSIGKLICVAVVWLLSEIHWLTWGYAVEIQGKGSWMGMTMASWIFALVNFIIIYLICLKYHWTESIPLNTVKCV